MNSTDTNESVFQTEGWLETLKKTHGYRIFQLGQGSVSLALIKSKIFGNRLISIPFSDYGGPKTKAFNQKELLEETIDITEKLGVDFTELRTPLFKQNLTGFSRRNDYCTFILNLQEKNIESRLEKRVRNGINKAKREDVSINIGQKENLAEFYDLYVSTVLRLGSPPQPRKFFDIMFRELGEEVQLVFASIGEKKIAASIFLTHGEDSYFSYSCSLKDYSNCRANDLLLWEAIKRFSSHGFKRFHFGRTRPNSGVYFYKKGWGGNEFPMPYFYIFNKRVLQERQEVTYKKASELWRRAMPKSLATRLGPKLIRQIG